MNQIKNIKLLRWAVVFFYLLTILINYISQAIPFNGQTNGEVSDQYATLFTPADYAFSIWGIIYLTLGAYVFFQALWASSDKHVYDEIGKWLILSFVATSAWLPAFQYEQIALSVLIMLVILFSLIRITIILIKEESLSRREKGWLKIPFGLYLGWISVATIVNVAVLWKYGQWPLLGMNELTWLLVMLAVGFILAIIIGHQSRNGVYILVFVWAYFGIAFKEGQSDTVFTYAVAAAAFLLILDIFLLYRQYKLKKHA
ncbi:TspO/MBR family protein [Catalinimonas niigatensis]|uniref:TspO/MBR family protein n=1 Tax=Catalinimonas niigatensis TaxID=1397264 RepID=UPI002665F47B|nr:TspO/MBR family protein [Catalinimonas niigatensis]WPP51068.1 TspO/MBR family protein [Catalinimonas niigatensis]